MRAILLTLSISQQNFGRNVLFDELQNETLANGSKICSGFFEFVLKIIKMDKRKWTKDKISFRPLLVFIVLIDDSWLRVYRERNAKSIVMEIIKMDKKKSKIFFHPLFVF